jgi:ATP-dependent RNA helicase DDX24/MAK5
MFIIAPPFEALVEALCAGRDVIGAAETGSGKTLAYGLPILHEVMMHRLQAIDAAEKAALSRSDPEAANKSQQLPLLGLIVTPTRELALQVSEHLLALFDSADPNVRHRHQVVPIVGGMSEHKQRRLLARRPAVVVATPGRLWDLINLGVDHISQLESLRFLVIDEADRMVEQGSFPELEKLLDLIERLDQRARDAATSREPGATHKRMRQGLSRDDEADVANNARSSKPADASDSSDDDDDELLAGEVPVEMLDDDLLRRIEEQRHSHPHDGSSTVDGAGASTGGGDDHAVTTDEEAEEAASAPVEEDVLAEEPAPQERRQTFIFSATLMLPTAPGSAPGRRRDRQRDRDRAHHATNESPVLERIMQRVGLRGDPAVLDLSRVVARASGSAPGAAVATAALPPQPEPQPLSRSASSIDEQQAAPQLPAGLKLLELRVVAELKASHLYLFLCNPARGRTLVFVNSIASVRRITLLLHTLRIEAKPLHAQMQQRQRLKHLDHLKNDPRAIIIATDVASRGLHVTGVKHVIHYDLPRSPQIFIHRAGRTARAAASGASLSFVSPQDEPSHRAICAQLQRSALEKQPFDQRVLQRARERVGLAEKIARAKDDASRVSAKDDWFRKAAAAADLELEDDMLEGVGRPHDDAPRSEAARAMSALEKLLTRPLHMR